MFSISRSQRKVVFLVGTNALGEQQQEYLARHTGLRVFGISGFDAPDSWTGDKWAQVLNDNQVPYFSSAEVSFNQVVSFLLVGCPFLLLKRCLGQTPIRHSISLMKTRLL